jgi:hypothetical protein
MDDEAANRYASTALESAIPSEFDEPLKVRVSWIPRTESLSNRNEL